MAERNLEAFCETVREYLARFERWTPCDGGPRDPYCAEGKTHHRCRRWTINRPLITTNSRIAATVTGFVYVAGPDGTAFKIGMSSDPEQRCKDLGLPLLFAIEVSAVVVRAVETEALRRCGNRAGDGEWVRESLSDVIKAVQGAVSAIKCENYAKDA